MVDKHGRFRTVASRRTNAILKKLQILGHCANRSSYEYTQDEVNKIFGEIEKVTKEIKMRFQLAHNKNREFKL